MRNWHGHTLDSHTRHRRNYVLMPLPDSYVTLEVKKDVTAQLHNTLRVYANWKR